MKNLLSPVSWIILVLMVITSVQPYSASAGPGLLTQPWFASSNLDLREDFGKARKQGKILALLFEQRGCSYCQQMHAVNFQSGEIVSFIKENYYVVQLDYRGERDVVDLDGNKTTEADMVRLFRVNGTPNVVFIDENRKFVYRMPGYAPPDLFLAVFQYVKEKGYEHSSIQNWYKERY
jgi:thioredoxin-related protein